MRRTRTLLAMPLIVGTLAACNPTWTKEGKPNDASMPLPPDAKPPAQASTTQQPGR
jgi:hypothetical protein